MVWVFKFPLRMDWHRLVMPQLVCVLALFCVLLFALPTLVYANCRTGTAGECKKMGFIPGHNLVGEGIDITTLQRKGAYVVTTDSWQRPDGTCTLCANHLLEGKLQKVPLAVVDWRIQNECARRVSSSVIHSTVKVMESAASSVQNDWKVGLDITAHPTKNVKAVMAGSHSRLATFASDKSKSDRYSFTSHEISCMYYKFRTSDIPPLTNQFDQALQNLPEVYNKKTKTDYRQVVNTYGTHYITQLHLGGKIRDVTAIKTCEASLDGVSVDEVKDCLNLEASANVGEKHKAEAMANACRELKNSKDFKGSFHQTYNERESEVVGGHITADLLFSDGKDAGLFNTWVESLKSSPGIVAYSLKPLHQLASGKKPQIKNLKLAISDYILEKTLWKDCSSACPTGSQPSMRDTCSCSCSGKNGVNSQCCSTSRGLANLTVHIQQASGLWGDYTSKTDAYVKVMFEGTEKRTKIITDNDNPKWNTRFDFGMVPLNEDSALTVQVWDEDNTSADDLLGSCTEPLASGSHQVICYLNHGSLTYAYLLACGPSLGGHKCMDYAPSPESPPSRVAGGFGVNSSDVTPRPATMANEGMK